MFLLQSKHHNHSNVQTSRIYSMESQIELQVRLRASVVRLALEKIFPALKQNTIFRDKATSANWLVFIWNVGSCRERKTGEHRAKTLARTNNKLNPHKTPGRNRTQDTLVTGKRSHHCAIPAHRILGVASILIISCVVWIS